MTRSTGYIISVVLFCMAPMVMAKQAVGWIEHAVVYPGALEYKAKLDSGAKMTSLHCKLCGTYSQDGEEWVRIEMTDRHGKKLKLDRPVLRWVSIKRHYGDSQLRPVINLGICLAGVYKETEVNLIDRQGLNYELLIGRQFLQDEFLIDSGAEFTAEPDCKVTPSESPARL